jgi:hypothetical protein
MSKTRFSNDRRRRDVGAHRGQIYWQSTFATATAVPGRETSTDASPKMRAIKAPVTTNASVPPRP